MGLSEKDRIQGAKSPKKLIPPERLEEEEKKRFSALQRTLLDVVPGVSKLDTEMLARYVETETVYQEAHWAYREALAAGDEKRAAKWGKIRNTHMNELNALARELNIPVRSRRRGDGEQPEEVPGDGGMSAILTPDFRRRRA